MAVPVEEDKGSPVISRTLTGITYTHTYIFPWALRETLLIERLGQQGASEIFPVFCSSVQVRPRDPILDTTDADSTIAVYEKGIATIVYSTPSPFKLNHPVEEHAITERISGNADWTKLPADGFQWGPGATGEALAQQEAPGRLATGWDYHHSRHNMATVPVQILSGIGFVNNDTVSPVTPHYGQLTFPPETLLFQPPTISVSLSAGGSPTEIGISDRVTMALRFSYRPNWDTPGVPGAEAKGWNAYWRPSGNSGKGGYQYIYKAFEEGDTQGPEDYYRSYPARNFEDLFTF